MTELDSQDIVKKGKATDISKHIAEILVQYRRRKHLSQRHIADLIGVSFQQYQKYEKGRDRLSLERAIVMCERLGIPLSIFTSHFNAVMAFGETPQQAYGTGNPETGGTAVPLSFNDLTDNEKMLLAIFRQMPEASQEEFLQMIVPIAKMFTNK